MEKAIRSLMNQTFKNMEFIIVDDGSDDLTFYKCKELQKHDRRIKILQSPNRGPSEARNQGIKAAKGEYIGFLDSDDYIEPDMYEKLYEAMQQFEVKVVFSNYKVEDGNGNIKDHGGMIYKNKIWNKKEIETGILLPMIGKKNEASEEKVVLGSVWRGLYSRELLIKKGIWFDGSLNYGEDLIWLLELLLEQDKIATVNKELYHYVIEEESLSNNIRRYNSQLWKKRKELALKIEQVIKGRICNDKLRERINWRYRVSAMESISIIGLSNNENINRKESLKEIIEDPCVKKAFSAFPEMKSFQACLYRNIKRKSINNIRLLYYFRRLMK